MKARRRKDFPAFMKTRKSAQTEQSEYLEGCVMERFRRAMVSPYRFFVIAAVLAALFSVLPTQADAPDGERMLSGAPERAEEKEAGHAAQQSGVPAGADLSERTQEGAYLHRTLRYACGHSVQRREALPPSLVGLSHAALEKEIGSVIPEGKITGFSAQEVDVARQMEIPCPLHWVLRLGENGKLEVLQNMTGEVLDVVGTTDVDTELFTDEQRQTLLDGMVFEDTQALEGYMESLTS